jgi:predicted RND superfamily exporter protein
VFDVQPLIARLAAMRKSILAFIFMLTALSVVSAAGVGVDNAVEIWFPADDPSRGA